MDIEKLENLLPHGSGIDCEWEFTEHKNGKVTCKNFFHAMNENGYYDGYMPFRFTVTDNNGKYEFGRIVCNENRRSSFYGLKKYLGDTIYYSLEGNLK